MFLLPLAVLFPVLMAFVCYAAGRKSKALQDVLVALTGVVSFLLCLMTGGRGAAFCAEGICGLGIHLRADGFRWLYGLIAAFMWMMTGMFSREYMGHAHNRSRYYFFNFITLGATLGVFYSDNLYTTFIFFEIMSLASYTWVAQEETPGAMQAAGTYLTVAIIGGLVTLMGLFMLYARLGTLSFEGLRKAASAQVAGLTLPVCLTAVGFAAKAGLFPLHIWLPKAHPVAPAPASALLSGILTKSGLFGLIVLCANLAPGLGFAKGLMALAAITMFLGALLALFSTDFKRTLACSSMSQIGFITLGLSLMVMLGGEGSLAAAGVMTHMMNHSLIKLTLFMTAGVVYMNLHRLGLNDIRGFGRKKPLLHVVFLLGALSIGCIPPLGSGYHSKSLLHEALIEWIHHLTAHGHSALPYQLTEVLFLISGGLTIAYMAKLYICIFWEKHPERQAEYDAMKHYVSKPTAVVLVLSALLLPLIGLLPGLVIAPAGEITAPFFGQAPVHHPIAYFGAENLTGAAWSMGIGACVYFLIVRPLLMKKENGVPCYVQRWPHWLDLETLLYRPLITRVLPGVLHAVTHFISRIPESLAMVKVLPGLVVGLVRLMAELPERLLLFLKNHVFVKRVKRTPPPVGNRFTYAFGMLMNRCAAALNTTFLRHRPIRTDFEYVLDASWREATQGAHRITASLSFGLLLMCIGLFITCMYLLRH